MHSATFNTQHNELIVYSDGSTLSVRTLGFRPYRQRMPGVVIAFSGSKVYYLHASDVHEEDVPLSNTMQQYVEHQMWSQAYATACLNVTKDDWAALGQAALMHLELDTARKAFIRTQDLLMLNFVHRLENLVKSGTAADVLKGEVLAHQVSPLTVHYMV